MQSTFFWREWPLPHRTLWLVFMAVFCFCLIYLGYTSYEGPEGVINWETVQEQKVVETTVHEFQLGPFQLQIPAESYVIFEFLEGSHVQHNQFASLVFLAVLILGSMVILTVISTLSRFWYYSGIALFIVFVIALRLEVLVLFGIRGYAIPSVFIFAFTFLSFYFQSLRPHTTLRTRLLSFCALAAVGGLLIHHYSIVPYPFLHITANAYVPALVLTILFILMVAHEIPASFVYITGQGTSGGLRHFLLISAIYLINMIITSLHELEVIQWDFVYINLYLLFAISAVLGIWGFRIREPQYETIFPFRPVGALLYISLGSIALITTAQFLGNSNDASLKIVRDFIIFSHTGYGIIFLTYVFSNFLAMMARGLPTYKLLYKPNRMPYFTFQFAGLVATLAFVFYSGWRQYIYHGLAGFYTYIADLYVLQENEGLAEDFLNQSRQLAFQSHRANYELGNMRADRLDFNRARYYFNLANAKDPSSFSVVNNSNLYLWERDYPGAIQSMRTDLRTLPNSPVLANNLGYAYAKTDALDSAAWFMSKAREHRLTRRAAEGNFFALAALESIPVSTDSLLQTFDASATAVTANALALATMLQQDIDVRSTPLADTVLNLHSASLLNNYIVYHASSLDTSFVNQAYAIAADSLNENYSEALRSSLAHAYYLQGNVTRALEVLAELAYISPDYRGKYNYIMGLFALEQGNPEIASSYFGHAETADYKDSQFYNAIALAEAGEIQGSLKAWEVVKKNGDAAQAEIAGHITDVLAVAPSSALGLTDAAKYQYCRYRTGVRDTLLFDRLSNTFVSADYKAQALLDMSIKQFKAGQLPAAVRYLSRISGLELTDRRLYNDVQHAELLMLAWQRDLQNLARQINKGVEFGAERYLEKTLYTALLHEANGEIEEAKKLYEIVGTWNPFFEEGLIAASEFFKRHEPETLTAYNILAEAIQINYNGYRLLTAYEQEASRLGFDEYAISARQRLEDLRARYGY